MIRVYYSNRLERLIDVLAEVYRQYASETDTLVPYHAIVVPNWNLETYLKLEIARRSGIAAGLEFYQLETFFRSLVPEDSTCEVLDQAQVHSLLIDILSDDSFLREREKLDPVRRYLDAPGADEREQLKFQLADKLANLFQEYRYSRPDLVGKWGESTGIDNPEFEAVEQWQRLIWLELFGDEGRLETINQKRDRSLVPMTRVFDDIPADELAVPDSVHVFGFSYLAQTFEGLFLELEDRAEVHFYTLNPCREFWEDVIKDPDLETPFSSEPVDGGQLDLLGPSESDLWEPEKHPAPLRLWGRAGRDQIRMLNRMCDYQSVECFEPIDEPPNTLELMQRDILELEPERTDSDDARCEPDDSINILACPNVERELEVVANEIWALVDGRRGTISPDFNDIAVVLNDAERETYQTHLESVFAHTRDIPFNLIDIDATNHSRLLEAIELLLSLPFGDLKRKDLLRLIVHDNSVGGRHLDEQTCIEWCDNLNILRGADASENRETYVTENMFTWDQGLKRLVLGDFIDDAGESSTDRILSIDGERYLPYSTGMAEREELETFVQLVRHLLEDTRFCRDEKLSVADWGEFLQGLLDRYITFNDASEETTLLEVRSEFGRFDEIDFSGEPVPYRRVYDFATQILEGIELKRGQYLADGVVVSSFLPMRPIPFDVIFVVGMNEGQFPRSPRQDPLDLRRAEWREGDVFPTDRDEYMFLETVLSARERLYVSYLDRDHYTGESKPPASTIQQLQHLLEEGYWGIPPSEQCIQHPLRRYDPVYFPGIETTSASSSRVSGPSLAQFKKTNINVHPIAEREAISDALGADLASFCDENGREIPTHPPALVDTVTDPNDPNLPKPLLAGQRSEDMFQPDRDREDFNLRISSLRNFLKSPLQGWAKTLLGMRRDDEIHPIEVDEEAYSMTSYQTAWILRDIFETAALETPLQSLTLDRLQSIYESDLERLELKGTIPTSTFRAPATEKHMANLEHWLEQMKSLHPGEAELSIVQFGRSYRSRSTSNQRPLHFDIKRRQGTETPLAVALHGSTTLLDLERGTIAHLLPRTKPKPHDFIGGFLEHAALSAAGLWPDGREVTLELLPGKSEKTAPDPEIQRLEPLAPEEATRYLRTLIFDLTTAPNDYLLPIEAVLEHPDSPREIPDYIRRQIGSRYSSISSKYGPIAHPERFEPPDDIGSIIQRRFGPYFERWVE